MHRKMKGEEIMSINKESFDKFLGKVTNAAKKVAKKSEDTYEIAKIKLAISSEKTTVNELKQKLGGLVYESYLGNEVSNEDVENVCKEIENVNASIAEKEASIENIKAE